ncbi:hypothetical protein Tco_1430510 [Tanacetum coccineum]
MFSGTSFFLRRDSDDGRRCHQPSSSPSSPHHPVTTSTTASNLSDPHHHSPSLATPHHHPATNWRAPTKVLGFGSDHNGSLVQAAAKVRDWFGINATRCAGGFVQQKGRFGCGIIPPNEG